MSLEIERKFLIDWDVFKTLKADGNYFISQGYILNTPEKVVRIRVTDDKSYITIKGKNVGASRPEFEYLVPKRDAIEMLSTMCENVIEKTRHIYHIFGDVWEIDEFHGDNEGLIVAECEIPTVDYDLKLPNWVTKEVTDDVRYFNSNLSITPYKDWK